MQYTIESRCLNSEPARRPPEDVGSVKIIEARNADDAIFHWIRDNDSELMSLTRPARGESIATVRKDDALFLVRIYPG